MKHEDQDPVTVLAEHLAECANVSATIVVDGNADGVIAGLTSAGWEDTGVVEYIGGKRIRYVTRPVEVPH
jgi:hypothetical protein